MVEVPTWEQFEELVQRVEAITDEVNALEARIAELEALVEPVPEPPPTGDGVQAKRVVDAIGLFGVNTFSSLVADQNLWGSWPADYTPASVIDALNYLTGDTGHAFRIREYHYASRTDMQIDWMRQIVLAVDNTRITMCVGANGTPSDAASLAKMDISWLEGLNEPNTDFGSGQVPFADTLAIQQALQEEARSTLMGPSIVAGMPHPEGWILPPGGYCETQENVDALNASMSIGNGHFYPPDHPDALGTSLAEYIGGLWTCYNKHPIALTEYHPTLFNSYGLAPGQPGWSGERDAYYTLCALFRAVRCTTEGIWWYALFDYGTTYVCGLFPRRHADNPRPAAVALRNLCTICADSGADNRSFTPGRLDVSVIAPDDVGWDLYQGSDGKFYIPVWHSAREPNSAGDRTVKIFLPEGCTVALYEPAAGVEPIFSQGLIGESVQFNVHARAMLLVVTP